MKWSLPGIVFTPRDDPQQRVNAITEYLVKLGLELGRIFGHSVDLRQNIRGKYVTATSHASADTEFTVTHNLGVIPFMYIANTDEGFVYDSRRDDWTSDEIYLKCSGTAASIRLFVLG